MRVLGLLLYCTVTLATDVVSHENPIVTTLDGSYEGFITKSQSNKDIFTFLSIRYGEPPTGQNRFKAALPAKPHHGIFNATQPGPVCAVPYKDKEISEDCLRLNIHTPGLSQNQSGQDSQPSKPVIVFFHPGSYWESFGSSYGLGPHYALDQDIVLVTPNYRLGALGFLSTGDERAPGNAGLKDQVLALKWVQKNIKFFGGDPSNVTLAGYNTGAASASMHIASPMSSGLFHRTFLMGSVIPIYNSLPSDRKNIAKKQAGLLGCPSEISDEMFNCLAGKSAKEFADTYHELSKFNGHPVIFMPVVESELNGDNEPFITAQPADLVSQRKGNDVPCLSVVTRDEFVYLAMRAEEQAQNGNTKLYDRLNDKWEKIAPKRFDYERETPKSFHISRGLKKNYFNDQRLQAGSYQALGNLYSDLLTFYPVYKWGELYERFSSEPHFRLSFNYENSNPFKTWSNGTSAGVTHYDLIVSLFKIAGRDDISNEDLLHVQKMWELIANFARTGDPMPEPEKYSVKWEQSTQEKRQYLEYSGKGMKMVEGSVYQERMKKLDELMTFASNAV